MYSSFYHLCVIDYGLSSQNDKSQNRGKKRQRRAPDSSKTYVTAEFKSSDLPLMVLVGDGSKLGGYENRRLSSGHTYRLFVRVYVRQDSKYVNSASPLTEPVTLPLLKTTFDPKTEEQSAPSTAKKSGSNNAVIAVAVIATLLILVIAAILLYFIRSVVCITQ